MNERLAATGSGTPTAYAGEKALHSRYNPPLEAEKYVNALSPGGDIRFFILIEPALGYIIPVLRKKFPGAKIIVLHVSDFFVERSAMEGGLPVWSPGKGPGLQEFLEGEIPDVPAAAVKIVEWRPALGAYGKPYLGVLRETVEFVRRIDANAGTARGFGRRWFKNAFKNLGIIKKTLSYAPGFVPILITGAGPGLEEALPLIREAGGGNSFFILASSSSVQALLAGGLFPDLIISTDGGNWALLHLHEALRKAGGDDKPALAAGLSAALPSQCSSMPVLPISDGSCWQKILLESLGIPGVDLPQRGTVTASALDLALSLTGGPVFLAGMDLAHRDIRTHARPYGFDRFWEEGVSRLSPGYSRAFVRAVESPGAHRIYAAWFRGQLASYPRRIYSLGLNNPVFAALPQAAGEAGEGFPFAGAGRGEGGGGQLSPRIRTLPGDGGAAFKAARALGAALENPALAPLLSRELSPLLLPDEGDPAPGDLAAEIKTLIRPYLSRHYQVKPYPNKPYMEGVVGG
ncbi:MAG: DUF115 domain-containing protein [Spirochaetaceae bacterium]|jgi:hypothetical protein|nr:DUF115 domain-containing protein [Spirochaetaceae bacterium]